MAVSVSGQVGHSRCQWPRRGANGASVFPVRPMRGWPQRPEAATAVPQTGTDSPAGFDSESERALAWWPLRPASRLPVGGSSAPARRATGACSLSRPAPGGGAGRGPLVRHRHEAAAIGMPEIPAASPVGPGAASLARVPGVLACENVSAPQAIPEASHGLVASVPLAEAADSARPGCWFGWATPSSSPPPIGLSLIHI